MKKFLETYLPRPRELREKYKLHFLGKAFFSPSLWRLRRRSVASGAALGIFCAYIPLPIQSLLAACLCLVTRGNLPVATIVTFVSNPLSYVFLYYPAYLVGNSIMGGPMLEKDAFTLEGLDQILQDIWMPLLLGCFIMGSTISGLTYLAVLGFWREGGRNKSRPKPLKNP
ncbi:MAG: DUF2062 domain-containing protein [Candidatus Eutrophobiaceae bacterium]